MLYSRASVWVIVYQSTEYFQSLPALPTLDLLYQMCAASQDLGRPTLDQGNIPDLANQFWVEQRYMEQKFCALVLKVRGWEATGFPSNQTLCQQNLLMSWSSLIEDMLYSVCSAEKLLSPPWPVLHNPARKIKSYISKISLKICPSCSLWENNSAATSDWNRQSSTSTKSQ